MYDFLSGEIKEACKRYQKKRDAEARGIVKQDPFTIAEIEKCDLSRRDGRMALRIAAVLERACKRGVDDPDYEAMLPPWVQGIGHGNILTAISALAAQSQPDLGRVAFEVARLTKDEFDRFISSVKARLKAIEAFKKIVEGVSFKDKKQEKTIQKMFEQSPWIVDPTYTQFLTADRSFRTLFGRLAKELQIGTQSSR